jgi:hypothetical protein
MHLLPLWVLSSALASTPPLQTTLPGGTWELRASGGTVSDGYANLSLSWDVSAAVGITDRIQASLAWPALAVRFGEPGQFEGWIAAGAYGVRLDPVLLDLRYELGPALGLRWWLGPSVALSASVEGSYTRWLHYDPTFPEFTLTASGGLTVAVNDAVTVHVALAASNTRDIIPNLVMIVPHVGLGSVQRIAMRRPPLVQVRVLPFLTADVLASIWVYPLGIAEVEGLVGFTARWP